MSSQYGGGVYAVKSLVMSGCVVSGNSAVSGGGISIGDGSYSGGAYDYAAITTTTFDGNTVAVGCGGGLRNANYSEIHISNSTFINNRANNIGGGICSEGGSLTVRSSTLAFNQATEQGGGVWAHGINTIYYSTFYGNTAPTAKMTYRASGNFTTYGSIFAGSGKTGYCAGGTAAGIFTPPKALPITSTTAIHAASHKMRPTW